MKTQNPFPKALKNAKRKLKLLKLKFFLLVTLPVAVITIGRAVIKEYSKIKIRQAASSVKTSVKNSEGTAKLSD